jgi:predicted small lipoprotein YifL
MKWFALLLLAFVLTGCGPSTPATPPSDPAKKITWSEYQKMDAEQKDDPYVVDNLDDEAKKKRAESARKKK